MIQSNLNKQTRVLLVGPVLSYSGYGEHARCVLRSLVQSIGKFDIHIAPTTWGRTSTDITDTPENRFINACIQNTLNIREDMIYLFK